MTQIEAVYENGLFRPVEPVELPERTRVTVAIPGPGPAPDDAFFPAAERMRLADLMARWRQARDAGTPLPAADQVALDALIAAELQAAIARSAAALQAARP